LPCIVVVDTPQTDGRWGNTIAGPVFNAICMEAARYLGIPPSERIDSDSKKGDRNNLVPPSVKYDAELKSKDSSGDKHQKRNPAFSN
jgi:hypothetical protein